MAFVIDNPTDNKVSIYNTDPDNTMIVTIAVLGDSGEFDNLNDYIEYSVDADTAIIVDLINDGIYRLTIEDNDYYIAMNSNMRLCEKKFLQKILCRDCNSCEDNCKDLHNIIRFNTLKERFYYIVNKFIQDQSVYDLISPDNAEILYWNDILKQLTRLCDTCADSDLKCLDC